MLRFLEPNNFEDIRPKLSKSHKITNVGVKFDFISKSLNLYVLKMYTITTFDYDCTKKCKKIDHGNAITAALTKRSISNEKLAKYISKICRNFAEILDEEVSA